MFNRRKMLGFVTTKENLINSVLYFAGSSIVTTTESSGQIAGTSSAGYGLFYLPVKSGKSYKVLKTEPLGSVFRVGFCNEEPTYKTKVYNLQNITTQNTAVIKAQNNGFLIIQAFYFSEDGDIHEQVKQILEVTEE